MKSVHAILGRNSFWNLLRYFVNFAVIFVITPVIIKSIGNAQYGLWALIFSLVGYAGLLELGVQQATIKLVAEYRGREDDEGLNAVASCGMLFLGFLGVAVALFCWFAMPLLLPRFVQSREILDVSGPLLRIIAVDMFFVFVGQGLTGIGLGLHQYHYKCFFDIISGLLRLGLTIMVLSAGYGIAGLAAIKVGLDLMNCLTLYWICRKGFAKLRFSMRYVSRAAFKSIIRFGGKLFTVTTISRINIISTPVLISYFLSTVWNAYYSVATGLVGYANQILWSATASFLPVFSELGARGQPEVVRGLYYRYSRYILILSGPMYVCLFLLGPDFVGLWINPEYAEKSRVALLLLAAEATVSGMQPIAERMVIGCGDVSFYSRLTTATIACALALSVILLPSLGIAGPPLAMLSMTTLQQSLLAVHINRRMGVNMISFFRQCHLRLLLPAAAFALCLAGMRPFLEQGRYPLFLAGATAAVALYLGMALFTALTPGERTILADGIASRLHRPSPSMPGVGSGMGPETRPDTASGRERNER
ncbi:polysaccharide biosynthesis protein [Desulfovibrio sp. X2]|uniref:oligosaccharide flippase family protein n=1 Tax=Desulfovibrio sp. X2 TaxID=941449 RepID=UPI000358A38B|nr:oligosaccharide flippase family protein [Desulfovibrio sp. X2]EPR37230.1 polysaccharide biosynthesis protein [Desulfovibrio sp. X2]